MVQFQFGKRNAAQFLEGRVSDAEVDKRVIIVGTMYPLRYAPTLEGKYYYRM